MKTFNQIEPESMALAAATHAAAHDDGSTRQTILLVEDDRSLRRYLEVVLQKAGYNVITAGDGLEAMKIAMTTAIDAVITDAIMPHINGHELCRFLRSQTRLAHLPVILLSGLESNATATAAAAQTGGANIYLGKPVAPQELINHLEQLL